MWKTQRIIMIKGKINELWKHISMNNITELNRLIYAGAKVVCEKSAFPPKKHEQTLKTWKKISTGKTDKKSKTTSKNDKTEEEPWNRFGRKEKSNTTNKTKDKTGGNKPEGTSERRKMKKISRQNKTIQTKEDIPQQRKIFYQQIKGECTKTYQQPDNEETKQFWYKIWEWREHNRKAEWISNIGKELEGLEETLKAKIHLDPLRATLPKVPN